MHQHKYKIIFFKFSVPKIKLLQVLVSPSALTLSKCENFDPFFHLIILFFDTQKTFYLIVKGVKNAFLMPFLRLSK